MDIGAVEKDKLEKNKKIKSVGESCNFNLEPPGKAFAQKIRLTQAPDKEEAR
jgi:hypothetical protein